jgi:pimeloyl-ACP methyl ester carboxylesterase
VSASGPAVERYEIRVPDTVVSDLRERLARAKLPSQPEGYGWALGTDLGHVRLLCEHWRTAYDFARLSRLNELGSSRWDGIHFLRAAPEREGDGQPVVLLHGWPSGPIEYASAARLVARSGREAIVPSLPGYAWSNPPHRPLNAAQMAERLHALVTEGLGHSSYAVAGGDWGGMLALRMAYDHPESVVALHISTPHALPLPGDLASPPLSEAEGRWAERARRWRRHQGHHLQIQGAAPDAIAPALTDSPAGLAAYLLDKYRTWSDSGGELERRFTHDDLCDFLTMYWSTGSIASSMRLYFAEAADRWRLAQGERISAPTGIALYEGDMGAEADEGLNPPREWSERLFTDLRRWTEMDTGGHFAAFEEPEAYAGELLALLDQLSA